MKKTFTNLLKIFTCSFLFWICCGPVFAQTNTLKGVVTDAEEVPLPGVTVLLKGSTTGTVTNFEGAYTLTLPRTPAAGDTLIFSFVGYTKQEVPYNNATTLNIQLKEGTELLSEVVVTALGIKREEKALGYATQTVSGEALTAARSNNFANALSGKVAGLNMNTAGSGPVNSVRISLRGDASLNPNGNNALVVLDGVPMNSGLTSSGVGNAYGAGSGNDVPVDFGNGISDINPEDIESITVLKGASATALYGSRAANGALIITTKSGTRKGKGLGVSINSTLSFNDVLKWPDYQYEWGQGTGRAFNADGELYYSYGNSEDGSNTGGTSSAYGPRFRGQYYYQYDPLTETQSAERVLWRPYEDNIKGFWRTGSTISNSIALDGGNDHSTARVSLTHTKNEWIMPNTGFERIAAALSVNTNISSRISLAAKVNYTNRRSDNLPATGYNNQSIAYFMIFQNPSIPLAAYEGRWKQGQEQIDQLHPFSRFIDNPYLIAYEMTNAVNNHTTVGNLSATYTISPKFDVMVRSGIAMSQELREHRQLPERVL